MTHHIVADDGSFDTGVLTPGQSYLVTFETPGTYSFHDALNPSIKGDDHREIDAIASVLPGLVAEQTFGAPQ